MLVDVAINYFGKPYQTIVAIASLFEHCSRHIGTVFLIAEPQQPEGGEQLPALLARHDWPIEVFVPRYHLGWAPLQDPAELARDPEVRLSMRYQYAFEATDKPYVFTTHNDMLFTQDALQPLLDLASSGDYAGVGHIGQCWNCPASAAGVCESGRYAELDLTFDEAVELYRNNPSGRPAAVELIDRRNAIPLPECRLNEWFALIDVETYRRETVPAGDTEPFGSYSLMDLGDGWFRSMVHKGYRFAHYNGGYRHSWAAGERPGGGHPALFDKALYDTEEKVAEEYYGEHYRP